MRFFIVSLTHKSSPSIFFERCTKKCAKEVKILNDGTLYTLLGVIKQNHNHKIESLFEVIHLGKGDLELL